ncbi:unnamed protein product [Linum tenue]|uniref:Uncharacterized protein n=1 Tax=Linum tenue TaxID=586396 RepID=A0AAV0MDF3_9ROSI|nr:unnamed protein product [Linum tenue]
MCLMSVRPSVMMLEWIPQVGKRWKSKMMQVRARFFDLYLWIICSFRLMETTRKPSKLKYLFCLDRFLNLTLRMWRLQFRMAAEVLDKPCWIADVDFFTSRIMS